VDSDWTLTGGVFVIDFVAGVFPPFFEIVSFFADWKSDCPKPHKVFLCFLLIVHN
jgi:hypothetical protein